MTTETHTNRVAPVVRSASVRRTPEDAFRIFTTEIGAWWPLPNHGLFGSESGGVVFRDDQLIEQSVDGREVVWAEVLAWEPPRRFVMAWHPGGEAADASEVEVVFEADGDGTRVIIEHRGWEAFAAEAEQRRRGYVGPNAWGYVLDHYADGAESNLNQPDLAELAAAYETFFAEAAQGGFGSAPNGEWNAEQVVAHVALNDAAMVAVGQALVHQNPARFQNQTSQDLDVLASFIAAAGDMAELIRRGRSSADMVLASLLRLAPDQRAIAVDCHLTHDGEIMVDQPMPWEMVAVSIQADRHLPAHIEQLANLRVSG